MPIYDPVEQRMVIRVVYDGVAFAGKTTNLRQLCVLFASQRQSEVVTPSELRGRTLYFDWLQITAGVACGIPLLSQVLSVPGQGALAPRRRHLLATADVVVFVCSSDPSPSSIERARDGLAVYDAISRDRGHAIPIVIQANKQDRSGALTGRDLLSALGRTGAPVVEAIANDGVGVVDTFVHAVRTVVRDFEERVDAGMCIDVRRAEAPMELLRSLERESLDPEWAAEMLLEEAQAALMLDDARAELAADDTLRRSAAAALQEIGRAAAPPSARGEERPAIGMDSTAPALPSHAVPTGFIWPAHTGRAILRALDLPVRPLTGLDATGCIEHIANGHIVRTSLRAAFPDAESARQALVRTARAHTQIAELLVPETVLVAQQTDEGSCWIWTVRPQIETAAKLSILGYVGAVVGALSASLRHGLTLEMGPEAFGVQGGRTRYIGSIGLDPASAASLNASLSGAASAIAAAGLDVAAFYTALEAELGRRLTAEERTRAGIDTLVVAP